MGLRQALTDAMKAAMKAKQADRLQSIRFVLAAVKQKEIDERIECSDNQVIEILTKMVKQRKDAIAQYTDAGREELAAKEQFDLEVTQEFLPPALDEAEIDAIIDKAVSGTNASSMKDMGKVMGLVKAQVAGRADMGQVSGKIKSKLTG